MASDDQVDFKFFHGLFDYRFTEDVAYSSIVVAPLTSFDVE